MNNFWKILKKPIIGLAPMAGITDSAFRQVCKKYGTQLVYSEMVSSYGLVRGDKKAFSFCHFRKKERPIIIQIFGREPKIMAEAALLIETKIKADGVDINFGCPARRVVSSGHGAALMDEPELAVSIVKEVVRAVSIPVSVKCRLGANNKSDIYDFAKEMENAGVSAIAIHGRTLDQGFSGKADWEPIYKVKNNSKIIILGNGDIKTKEDVALRLKNNKLDGILIGRAALGNPFIFEGLEVIKNNPKRFLSGAGFRFGETNISERKKIIIEHAELIEKEKGERGLIEMRKHLCWYVKGISEAKQLRQKLVKIKTIKDIKKVINCFNYS